MWRIRKTKEPPAYKKHIKTTPGVSFRYMDKKYKDLLKKKLLSDQGGLCCYCGCEIDMDTATIEHFYPINPPKGSIVLPNAGILFSNMLAVCKGGSGNKLHCDKAKNNKIPPYSILTDVCNENNFSYDKESGIVTGKTSNDTAFIGLLKLNDETLKTERKNAIEGLDGLSGIECKKLYLRLLHRNENNCYIKYAFVLRSYIYENFL